MSTLAVRTVHDSPSRHARVLRSLLRSAVRPTLRHVPVNRWSVFVAGTLDGAARLQRRPQGVVSEIVVLPGFDAELVQLPNENRRLSDGVILYFHGGAFLMGGLNTHRPVVAALARRAGVPILNVAYRKLPGTTIEGSVQDCLVAYKWLLSNGADPATVIFAGDSAGGLLVFATAIEARDRKMPVPAGLIGFSPWLDLDCGAKLAHPSRTTDAYLPVRLLDAVTEKGALGVPNPVDCDLAGLPPVLLIASDAEVLRVDSELMSARLAEAGVPCAFHLWKDQVHAFTTLSVSMPESRAAIDEAATFVNSTINNRRRTAV
ncbi:alpha/beta hydrolase [Hoyosella subflava]|uniref:Esterase n=1 Tax=Hoyosella subflava (strain DSM 45089 / JCM 17490 / NBRC 109087 / DQS3-9A1) TaxID=443218 RepID=F6ERP9_HOYSD|nr:alpha/beta hydrolase [Hoyosella subflava]AEF39626.1 Esterase [Hoyosella subflava DQS3-9A1]